MHPAHEILTIIRRGLGDKALPNVKFVIELNNFYKQKTGAPSPHCTEILAGILDCVAEGRSFEGTDAETHMSRLSEKFEGGSALIDELYARVVAEIRDGANAGLINPYEAVAGGLFGRIGGGVSTHVKAEAIANSLFLGINASTVKKYVTITRKYKAGVKDILVENIRKTIQKADKGSTKAELAAYALKHIEQIELTEQNTQKLISVAFAHTSGTAKAQKKDGSGEYSTNIYAIPTSGPLGTKLKAYRWDEGKGSFQITGDTISIPMHQRTHFIDALTDKDDFGISSPTGACFSILYSLGNKDKKEK
jgi:hypothetical protein